jgi:hypothetical protein
MTAKARDRIVVESEKVGRPAREGEILEIIEASYGTRYRVAWDDGHESTFRPSAGSAQIVPAARARAVNLEPGQESSRVDPSRTPSAK